MRVIRKVTADLWNARGRALLVIAAMSTGLFAVVGVSAPDVILGRELARSFARISPASATLRVDPAPLAVLDSAARVAGVRTVDGARSLSARVRVGDAWKAIVLYAPVDYAHIQINRLRPMTGAWPPGDGQILLERSAVGVAGAATGGSLTIRNGASAPITLSVAGTLHDFSQAPAWQEGVVYGYVNRATMTRLTGSDGLSEIRIIVSDRADDIVHIRRVAADVARMVGRTVRVRDVLVPPPNEHPHQGQMNALLGIKQAFAIVALGLSCALIVVLLTAMLVHHRRQIGIMKAIGASRATIVRMYLVWTLGLAICADLIAIPTGLVVGRAYARYMATFLNFDIVDDSVPLWLIAAFALAGIVPALLVALVPIVRAANASARSALSDVDTISPSALKGRIVTRMRRSTLGRLGTLSIANSLRSRGRFVLTASTLAIGGALFLAALDLDRSFNVTVATSIARMGYDIVLGATAASTPEQVAAVLQATPGVTGVHTAPIAKATSTGNSDAPDPFLITAAGATAPGHAALLAGRWLNARDDRAIVANHVWSKSHPGYAPGDSVSLRTGDDTTRWLLVGVVREVMAGATVYAPAAALARATRNVPLATAAQVTAALHDAETVAFLRAEIERRLESAHVQVTSLLSLSDIAQSREDHQRVIVIALLVMAGLSLVVGGLGLASMLSVGIFERAHEIGVMRALGASRRHLLTMVLVEGLWVALVGWTGSLLLSLPATYVLDDVFGRMMLATPLDVAFSGVAIGALAAVATAVAALASGVPAWRATTLEPRELLATT